MSQENERAERIMAESEALIAKVQRELDEAEAFYREQGIDLEALERSLGPKEKEEVARLLAEDKAAIERAVDEEKARLSFNSPSQASRPGKFRSMI